MAALERFRVPSRNGEVLAVPGFDIIPELIEENRSRLDRSDVTVGELTLREFRALARSETLSLVEGSEKNDGGLSSRPLLLTGHQPELSHPGVWVKNFALNGLSRKVGGIPINLIVDNDTLKTRSLRLPYFQPGELPSVHLEPVPFDTFRGEIPYEDSEVVDANLFRKFPRAGGTNLAELGL